MENNTFKAWKNEQQTLNIIAYKDEVDGVGVLDRVFRDIIGYVMKDATFLELIHLSKNYLYER